MEKHEHTVALHSYDEGGGRLYKASSISTYSYSGLDDEEFHFCPECGASLGDFWKAIHAARAESRRQIDAERAERDAYRDKRPT